MRIAKYMLCGLALAGLLAAQKPASEEAAKTLLQNYQRRIFQVKYADVRSLRHVLDIFGYGIQADPDLHVLAVSAPPDVITAIEDAIKRLDVPSAAAKDVDITVYLVLASQQAGAGDELPDGLPAVASQLKGIFAFKSFRMLDTVVLRTQPGNKAGASGILGAADAPKTRYHLNVRPSAVTDDPNGRLIRLNDLSLALNVPVNSGSGQLTYMDAGINTEITVREGQKVVVGKSNLGTPDQALVLVVTAKVAE